MISIHAHEFKWKGKILLRAWNCKYIKENLARKFSFHGVS